MGISEGNGHDSKNIRWQRKRWQQQKFMSMGDKLQSLVATMEEEAGEVKCDNCNLLEVPANLSRCSRCKNVYYCDVKCQQMAWKRHKKVCRAAAVAFSEK